MVSIGNSPIYSFCVCDSYSHLLRSIRRRQLWQSVCLLAMTLHHHHWIVVVLSVQLLLYFKHGVRRDSLVIGLLSVRMSLKINLMNGAHGIVQLVLGACSRDDVLVAIILIHFGGMSLPISKVLIGMRANQLMLYRLMCPRMLSWSHCFICRGHLLITGNMIRLLLLMSTVKNGRWHGNWSRQVDRQSYCRLCRG